MWHFCYIKIRIVLYKGLVERAFMEKHEESSIQQHEDAVLKTSMQFFAEEMKG